MRVETVNLNKRFGGVVALEDVSLDFHVGTVTAIIGPNGAGKTTLFNVMAGFLKPDSGSVLLIDDTLGGKTGKTNIVGLTPHEVAARGVGVLFQDARVFKNLSSLENVAAGVKNQSGENPFNAIFRRGKLCVQEKDVLEKARELLNYVGLSDKLHTRAEQLSYGQQKLLAIARLLAGEARVLLLDEPTSGVHPDMTATLLDLIQRLARVDGRVIIMIEHNLNVVKRIGDLVYLMAQGRVEGFGKPDVVLHATALKACFQTL